MNPIAGQVAYEFNKLFEEAGLDDIPVRAGRIAGSEINRSIRRGKDDDRHVREADIGTESLKKAKSGTVP